MDPRWYEIECRDGIFNGNMGAVTVEIRPQKQYHTRFHSDEHLPPLRGESQLSVVTDWGDRFGVDIALLPPGPGSPPGWTVIVTRTDEEDVSWKAERQFGVLDEAFAWGELQLGWRQRESRPIRVVAIEGDRTQRASRRFEIDYRWNCTTAHLNLYTLGVVAVDRRYGCRIEGPSQGHVDSWQAYYFTFTYGESAEQTETRWFVTREGAFRWAERKLFGKKKASKGGDAVPSAPRAILKPVWQHLREG